MEVNVNKVRKLLDGNRAKFRLEDSVALRTAQFDKRVKKNRSKQKAAKLARKRNRS